MSMTLTLHVVEALERGYAAAGLVGTATMLGSAIGAPLLGRLTAHRSRRRRRAGPHDSETQQNAPLPG